MKIVFTTHSLKYYGGTESYTYTLSKELLKQGHEVFCFSPQLGNVAKYMREEGIFVTNNLNDLPTEIDIIHGQHKLETTMVCAKYPYTPAIFVSHGTVPWQEQPPLIDQIVYYVAISEEVKKYLNQQYDISNDKIKIIHNGIDLNRFKELKEINYRPQKLLLLSNRYNDNVLNVITKSCEILNIELKVVGQRGKKTWDTEKEINDVDIVVSLGRGVLEAIACKRFVIVYDYKGGDGVLDPNNYYKIRENNFSGRTYNQNYTIEQFVNEIEKKYSKDIVNQNYNLIKENHNVIDIASNFVDLYKLSISNSKNKSISITEFSSILNDGVASLSKELEQKEQNILYTIELNEEMKRENTKIQKENTNMDKKLVIIQKEHQSLKEQYEKLQKEKKQLETLNTDYYEQLNQKEANTRYLLELNNEKDIKLNEIYNSRVWKIASKYRKTKIKIIKVINNPKILIDKIRGTQPRLSLSRKSGNIVLEKNKKNPLISVVIPVYDRTEVLKESIESILNQSYQNLELIIVCDGSPKDTINIVKQYEVHEKVRVFYYKNNSGNAVRGRNKAIKEARGKYLAFQDSDDIATLNRLELSLEYINKHNVDVVYGGWRAIVDGSRDIDIEDGAEVFSPDCDYNMLKEICVPCQSTVMVSLEALRTVGGLKTEMKYREDHELWLRLAYNNFKFKAIPKILTNLRLHESNLELTFKETDDYWYKLMLQKHIINTSLTPKIGYVIPGCGISGGIAVICQHVNRLLKRGLDVVLITEDEKTSIDWFPNQLVEVLPMSKLPDNLDIVVATGWSTAYTIQNINAKRKIYFVQSDESRFYEKGSKMYKEAWESYKFEYEYMTEAKWIKEWLKETFGQVAHYVPNGLDEKIIHKTEPIVPKGEKVRVLLEGPIDIPFKGMADAFMAVKDLDCEIWCISSAGRPKPEWRCDRFFEKVPMEQMKFIYSSCDIFLKMSRVEGFFGPPLEMMACGGAVVVGKVTGYEEYIEHGYNALVVNQGDVIGARKAVEELINNIELRKKLISNGKKTADKWKWDPTIDELEKVFLDKEYRCNE